MADFRTSCFRSIDRLLATRSAPRRAERRPWRNQPCLVAEVLEERALLAAVAPPAGIVSWWTADNTANDLEGLNNGALVSGATFAAGEVSQAFRFDGLDDRVQVADSPSLELTSSLSIEGWIRITAFPTPSQTHGEILFRGDDRNGLDPYTLSVEPDGTLDFQIASLTAAVELRAAVPTGQFIHVAGTLDDATGLMRLYVNGMIAAQTQTTVRPFGDLDPASNPSIGIGNHGGAPTTPHNFPFNGLIDELTVYDRALSGDEVQRIYDAGTAGKIKNANYFASDFPTAVEGKDPVMTFTITRAGDLLGTAVVNWGTSDGTAKAGIDYVAASGQLTFAPGQSQRTVDVTLLDDGTLEPRKTFGLVLSMPTTGYAVASGQGTIVDEAPRPFSREAGLEGFYFVGNQTTELLRSRGQLTFVNRTGGTSPGFVQDESTLIASGWGQRGEFDSVTGTITFGNGSVWTKVRDLSGAWLNATGRDVGITAVGLDLTFTNAAGQSVAGKFLDATTVQAPGWGVTGHLSEAGQRIEWSNGTVWDLVPDVSAAMTNAGGFPVQVVQSGSSLVLVNRVGQTSPGHFLDFQHITATGWGNIVGTLHDDSIEWSNGTVWTVQPSAGSDPEIGGLYDQAGTDARIVQAGSALTFVGSFGPPSAGHFVSATQVAVDDWGLTATISSGVLSFSNGDVWTLLPDLAGPQIDQAGKLTRVAQLERSLTFTDSLGAVTHGVIDGAAAFHETDGLQRTGTISGSSLLWNTGAVWTKLFDLRGDWRINGGTGLPAYISQAGLSVLFINETGLVFRGTFQTSTTISTTLTHSGTFAVAQVIDKDNLSFDNHWIDWIRPAPSLAFDGLFADPTNWPFV